MTTRYRGRSGNALSFIILLGVVSLLADITYEGARSVIGPFLFILGANATIVGLVAGLGEFVGYALRLLSGFLADRTGRYWLFTFIGYAMNVFSVPLLALAGYWEIAAVLIVLERLGKAIRTPSRDAMLSYAAKGVGRGWGFAIHEALDQIGAITGPLLIASVLYIKSYREAFAVLLIPAVLTLFALSMAMFKFPTPMALEQLKSGDIKVKKGELPKLFWLFLLFIVVSVVGYANFQLISYHLRAQDIVSDVQIPLLFAIAMGVDALIALFIGKIYDSIGLKALIAIPLLTLPLPFFAFSHLYTAAIAGILLWGAVMGMQETIMRAAIADITPVYSRGMGYGIFNAAYGSAWLLGGILIGALYDISISYAIIFIVVVEAASMPFFFFIYREQRRRQDSNL
ncbi:MAG: MFS transporter [Candidatus Methanospirareceae archaeon]